MFGRVSDSIVLFLIVGISFGSIINNSLGYDTRFSYDMGLVDAFPDSSGITFITNGRNMFDDQPLLLFHRFYKNIWFHLGTNRITGKPSGLIERAMMINGKIIVKEDVREEGYLGWPKESIFYLHNPEKSTVEKSNEKISSKPFDFYVFEC